MTDEEKAVIEAAKAWRDMDKKWNAPGPTYMYSEGMTDATKSLRVAIDEVCKEQGNQS